MKKRQPSTKKKERKGKKENAGVTAILNLAVIRASVHKTTNPEHLIGVKPPLIMVTPVFDAWIVPHE